MSIRERLSKPGARKALVGGILGGVILGGSFNLVAGGYDNVPVAHCHNRRLVDFPEWLGDTLPQRDIKDLARWLHTSYRNIEAGLGGTALCDVRFTNDQIESASAHARVKDISPNCLVLDQEGAKTDGQVSTQLFCAIPDETLGQSFTPIPSIHD
ncbi:MAG TPA: hypothetical protein VN778_02375 [Verrucomicrobiae bacterium]|nr:hypothetical protein [Verrucomicrobiae bacterium]